MKTLNQEELRQIDGGYWIDYLSEKAQELMDYYNTLLA
ncbi:MAG: bacteriocin [Bacteroidota bacterium]